MEQQPDSLMLAQVRTGKARTMSIENLSNEIFYEIFDYLDFSDTYEAFSNLNARFQQLITSSSLLVKFFLPHRPRFDMEYYCEHIILPNRHRIISLRNLMSSLVRTLFRHSVFDKSFDRLKNLTFYRVLTDDILLVLPFLKLLPHLSSLTISIDHFIEVDIDLHSIYQVVFVLPTLKYLNVDASSAIVTGSNALEIGGKLSSIEYLTMTHSCTLDGLTSFLKHTPRLRHLTCGSLCGSYDTVKDDGPLILPNLTYFWIYYCTVPFDEFEEFIEKHFSQLHVFRINTFSNENYIDPDRWKPLILQTMPRLRRFHFTYDVHWSATFLDDHFDSFVHHFSSPFWAKRDFIVELYVTSGRINYSSRSTCSSLRKEEHQFKKFLQPIVTSNRSAGQHGLTQDEIFHQTPAPIRLSIVYQNDPWSLSFMNSVGSMFRAIPITNLFIGLHKMPLSLFLKIIRTLPSLNTLHVPELSLDQLSSLSIEEEEDLRYFSSMNKVTNVNHRAEVNLTQLLMRLCPRMKYLEMQCVTTKNAEIFLRFVLMNSITHTPDLNLMKIWIHKANDQTVVKLKDMIDSEQLLSSYIMKRYGDYIFVRWNLDGAR